MLRSVFAMLAGSAVLLHGVNATAHRQHGLRVNENDLQVSLAKARAAAAIGDEVFYVCNFVPTDTKWSVVVSNDGSSGQFEDVPEYGKCIDWTPNPPLEAGSDAVVFMKPNVDGFPRGDKVGSDASIKYPASGETQIVAVLPAGTDSSNDYNPSPVAINLEPEAQTFRIRVENRIASQDSLVLTKPTGGVQRVLEYPNHFTYIGSTSEVVTLSIACMRSKNTFNFDPADNFGKEVIMMCSGIQDDDTRPPTLTTLGTITTKPSVSASIQICNAVPLAEDAKITLKDFQDKDRSVTVAYGACMDISDFEIGPRDLDVTPTVDIGSSVVAQNEVKLSTGTTEYTWVLAATTSSAGDQYGAQLVSTGLSIAESEYALNVVNGCLQNDGTKSVIDITGDAAASIDQGTAWLVRVPKADVPDQTSKSYTATVKQVTGVDAATYAVGADGPWGKSGIYACVGIDGDTGAFKPQMKLLAGQAPAAVPKPIPTSTATASSAAPGPVVTSSATPTTATASASATATPTATASASASGGGGGGGAVSGSASDSKIGIVTVTCVLMLAVVLLN